MGGPAGGFRGRGDRLDRWYREHPALLASEVRALEAVDPGGRGLEVGVGTGVLAEALDVDVGLDPAPDLLARARDRGVAPVRGVGENLPFADGAFERVLFLTTLCFLDDPAAALAEARRVLAPDGAVVAADLPRDSAWGRRYRDRARQGDPMYQGLALRTRDEVEALLAGAGLAVEARRGTLTGSPEGPHEEEAPRKGLEGCGYAVWRARPD